MRPTDALKVIARLLPAQKATPFGRSCEIFPAPIFTIYRETGTKSRLLTPKTSGF